MTSVDRLALLDRLRPHVERAKQITGWSWRLPTVSLGLPRPWDYSALAHSLLGTATKVLDIGTGGGERQAELLHAYKGAAIATESWLPNVGIAAARLGPSGVQVVHSSSLQLPFHSESFDLVLDRHEEFNPAEVARVLRTGGRFLTQQHGDDDSERELRPYFPDMPSYGPLFTRYQDELSANEMCVERAERHEYGLAFRSLEDLAFYLQATQFGLEWFVLERDVERLMAIERDLHSENGIVLSQTPFLIQAVKR